MASTGPCSRIVIDRLRGRRTGRPAAATAVDCRRCSRLASARIVRKLSFELSWGPHVDQRDDRHRYTESASGDQRAHGARMRPADRADLAGAAVPRDGVVEADGFTGSRRTPRGWTRA